MMKTFKPGTELKLIHSFSMAAEEGAKAFACYTSDEDIRNGYVTVIWDRKDKKDHDQQNGEYYTECFEEVIREWDDEDNK